jgi:putative transposase
LRTTFRAISRIRYVIHDRDSIFSEGAYRTLAAMGLTVLRTPVQVLQANAFCERLVGTIRRECLGFLIPLTERHLREILCRWVTHYNRGRPHPSLGPGLPDPPPDRVVASNGHQLPDGRRVAMPIVGGLDHESVSERPRDHRSTIFADQTGL